ncbi:PfkB family carbohydrate kinase [Lactobacillus sp. PV034]|uniref:PfkB family carbohydrate kinase n=1 Tax=Lactobacillus sp. PV034 TaxID=2594495 RepID=UPI00223FE8BB|nr:PfkB family carbohydrate kinase [Lactobacillus sp. PV034]QNQ81003.1 phosphofructokinase [Lactobacillus sp. PV034]
MIYIANLDANKEQIGEGTQIALVLKKLNLDSIVTGISIDAQKAKQALKQAKIESKFIEEKNTTIGQQELLDYLKDNLKMGDILVVAGKFVGIDPDFLIDLATVAAKNMVHTVVDVPYARVLDILPLHPLLVKPNRTELKAWYGKQDETLSIKDEIELAHDMVVQGADHVLLSLGKDGAAIVNLMHAYLAAAPEIEFKNNQGTGATILATFLAGMLKNHVPVRNLADSIAAASDTARKDDLTDFKEVAELQKLIMAEKITFEEAK